MLQHKRNPMSTQNKHPLFSDNVIETYFTALFHPSKRVATAMFTDIHIPKSDVFYTRAAIEAATGVRYPLSHVEEAMYLEGMLTERECYNNAEQYGV